MSVTFNTGTVSPTKITETTIATLAGGPFDLLSVYAQGGQTPDKVGQVAYRLYAVVGGLQSLIAETSVVGNPTASILQWQTPGSGATASQFVEAGGDSYVLTVQQVPGSSLQAAAAATATIAGVDKLGSTTDTNIATTLTVPPYSQASTGNVNGYAQFMDVAINQAGLPRTTSVIVYANCGGGSVEAIVKQDPLGGPDGTTAVIRKVALPVATTYRVAVLNQDPHALTVPTSVATYSEQVTGINPSALNPGPQLTVIRSVVPTAPTQVVWASSGYIDFVADCGADPTGVADAAPAMTRAWNFMLALAADPDLAETTLQLFIPPGKYSFRTSPIEPDFNFNTTTIEIYGCGDASIIQVGVGAGNFTIAAQNMFRAYIHDLAFVGLISPLGVSVDCASALVIAPRDWLIVERVRFIAVVADFSVVLSASGPCHFKHVEFGGCGCTNPTGAVLQANLALTDLVQVNFSDIPILNGYNFSGGLNSQTNLNWFYANGTTAGTTGGTVTMRDCLFDESAQCAILIDGGVNRIPFARLENIIVLASAIVGSTGCVRARNVDNFEIDGYILSGVANPAIDVPLLNLQSVTNYKLRAISLAIPTALCRAVVTDAASKGIIEASPGIIVSQVLNAEFPQQARGTAAAGGGTFVLDVPVPLDTVLRLRAVVLLTAPSADGTQSIGSAGLVAMVGVNNKNNITSLGTAIAGSKNPQNSADLVAAEVEWADTAFQGGGGSAPTAAWTVTGSVARLTVTNPSTAGVAADVSVTLEIEQAASPTTVISSPLVLGGLLVYQRADLGFTLVAGKVSQWVDQSGSADPNRTLRQTVAGQRPVYIVNDPAYANRPTLQFVSANSDNMTSNPWTGGPFVEPFTVMVIGNDDGTATNQVFIDNEHGAAGENLVWNQGGHYFIAGVNTTVVASATPKIIIAEHNGGTSPVNINTNTGSNLGALGENLTGMTVGATITPSAFLNGKIAEVAVWNRTLSATEKAQLNAYAAARYGIPIAP